MQAKDVFRNDELAANQAKSYVKRVYKEPTIKEIKMKRLLILLWLGR